MLWLTGRNFALWNQSDQGASFLSHRKSELRNDFSFPFCVFLQFIIVKKRCFRLVKHFCAFYSEWFFSLKRCFHVCTIDIFGRVSDPIYCLFYVNTSSHSASTLLIYGNKTVFIQLSTTKSPSLFHCDLFMGSAHSPHLMCEIR